MPYELLVPNQFRDWKIKIRDKERLEEAHVTIIRKMRAWRISLLTSEFMDDSPPTKDVPEELVKLVNDNIETLREEWDKMYPENQVGDEGKEL